MLRDSGLIPLSQDHHHALALCVFTDRALKADGAAESVAARARQIVEQFDREIRGHFEFEEQVLFPALEEFAAVRESIAALRGEHQRLYGLVDSLRSGPDRAVVEEFCGVLRQHVRTEEGVLFEEAQRLLTRERLDEIGAKRRAEVSRGGG